MKSILLLSGGLDSVVAGELHIRAGGEIPLAITFDYGQRAVNRERHIARGFCRERGIEHRVIELPWMRDATRTALVDRDVSLPRMGIENIDSDSIGSAKEVWVPNRNGAFISIAASIAEGFGLNSVVVGFNAEEARSFPDNSLNFVEAINASFRYSTQNCVAVVSPTLAMTKVAIAEHFIALAIEPSLFWPCYEGGERLCGRCESCLRTIRAFTSIGKIDVIRNRFEEKR